MKNKGGRPSDYTEELADDICELVAEGSNLHKIGNMKDYPSRNTLYLWLKDNEVFYDKYTRAREGRADWRASKIDELKAGLMDKTIDYSQARILFDIERWQAGKENPRVYSDKQIHTGPSGDEPIRTETTFIFNPVDNNE